MITTLARSCGSAAAILVGSDLSMMEALNSYGRPFHQRGREMVRCTGTARCSLLIPSL